MLRRGVIHSSCLNKTGADFVDLNPRSSWVFFPAVTDVGIKQHKFYGFPSRIPNSERQIFHVARLGQLSFCQWLQQEVEPEFQAKRSQPCTTPALESCQSHSPEPQPRRYRCFLQTHLCSFLCLRLIGLNWLPTSALIWVLKSAMLIFWLVLRLPCFIHRKPSCSPPEPVLGCQGAGGFTTPLNSHCIIEHGLMSGKVDSVWLTFLSNMPVWRSPIAWISLPCWELAGSLWKV